MKRPRITFTLPAPIKDAAEEVAAEEHRSVASLCIQALVKELKARGYLQADSATKRPSRTVNA